MKLARIHGPGDVRLDEVPEPTPGPDDVLIDVAACGICGSDVGYVKIGGVQGPAPEPMPIGHELAGTLSFVGAHCQEFAKVGDRVALHPGAAGYGLGNGGPEGGFTPQLLVRGASQGKSLFAIPDDMPFEIAALAEPLGVGMHAVDQAEVVATDRVAVFGAGPIGLAAVATLADRGVEQIVSVDRSPLRLDIARQLGATHTVNAAEEDAWEGLARHTGKTPFYWTEVVGANVFIEATGVRSVLEEIVQYSAPASRVSVVALHREKVEVDFMLVLMKELTIRGSIEYPERFDAMIELLARRDLSPMITHRYPLASFADAFEVAKSPDAGAKVMIEIGSSTPR